MNENEKLLKEGKLAELRDKYKECFDRIHEYEAMFREGVIQSAVQTDEALKELGAIFSSLNVVAYLCDVYVKNITDSEFNRLKIGALATGKLTTVNFELLKKEASESVNEYRITAAIFCGYRDSCDRLVSICQSSLKFEEKERKFHEQRSQ